MKRNSVVSGAMIVAAGVASSTGAAAKGDDPDRVQPKMTESGLSFDMVELDDDILKLGGADTGIFGATDATGGVDPDEDEFYLAQTWGGGTGNDGVRQPGSGKVRVPGADPIVVVDPKTRRSMTVLFNRTKTLYFDAQTGKEFQPPQWLRLQVEK